MLHIYLSIIENQETKDEFIQIYNNYKKTMKYIAFSITNDDGLSENIVHDSFVIIAGKINCFRNMDKNRIKGLISIIVKRQAINEINKINRIEYVDNFIEEPDESQSVDGLIISRETYARIISVIDHMDEIYKSVLMLKFVYEFSYKEISEMLNIPETTCRQRLHRGRKLAQVLLKKELMING